MLKFLERKFTEWRRRRTLARIRRQFAESGHPLDDLDDANIEAALTLGECRIEQIQITAKSIYFALRRLAVNREDTAAKQFRSKNLRRRFWRKVLWT